MNQQEIFEKVARHLLAQGKRARNEFGRCCYRTEDGLKCAVGCLIPEELYASSMESFGVYSELLKPLMDFLQVDRSSQDMDLLERLQRIHDCSVPEAWKAQLQTVAMEFGLILPEDLA